MSLAQGVERIEAIVKRLEALSGVQGTGNDLSSLVSRVEKSTEVLQRLLGGGGGGGGGGGVHTSAAPSHSVSSSSTTSASTSSSKSTQPAPSPAASAAPSAAAPSAAKTTTPAGAAKSTTPAASVPAVEKKAQPSAAATATPSTTTKATPATTAKSVPSTSASKDSGPAKGVMEKIEQVAKNEASVTSLDFSSDSSMKEDVVAALCKALEKNTALKKLLLNGIGMTDASAAKLADALKVNKGLEILHMETNLVGPAGVKAVIEMIKVNTTLVELRMGNQSTLPGLEVEQALAAAVVENNHYLTKLNYHGNDAGARTTIDRAMSRNSEEARQRRRAATGASSTAAPAAAAASSSGASGAKAAPAAAKPAPMGKMAKIIERLEQNDATLTELKLDGEPVCNASHGVQIAKALEKNTHLKHLHLDGTMQTTESGEAFANALKVNNTLETLSLEKNDIEGPGIKAIAEAMVTNTGLKDLRLNSQKKPTGNDAERALQAIMETNMTLVKLSLTIKDPGVRNYVNRGITRNTELARKQRAEAKK